MKELNGCRTAADLLTEFPISMKGWFSQNNDVHKKVSMSAAQHQNHDTLKIYYESFLKVKEKLTEE